MVLITKASVMSLLAFLLVFVGGAVFFYDSEPGMQAVTFASLWSFRSYR
jgi:hypothetical protein